MASQIVASLASAALVAGGFAIGGETRSLSALPDSSLVLAAAAAGAVPGEKCQVEVVRRGAPGSSRIERDSLSNGTCVCRIFTGPSATNGGAEDVVNALLRDRECADALAPADLGETAGAAGGGGLGGAVLPVVFGVGAIGLGVALAGSSKG